jgi:HupE / UreJ protein
MRRTSKIAVAILILLVTRMAAVHRIDEYLQATMVSIEANRIHASMRLIPGVQVASAVIAEIDSNADGLFSEDEERASAQRMLSDLSITIDGKAIRPQLVAFDFPALTQMREGLGEIHIEYAADLPNGGSNRALILANHHMNRISVYLMNVIVPDDPKIRILAQKRNPQQSTYELDYHQTDAVGLASKVPVVRVGIWLNGVQFSRLFGLGMRHIAEGTDHLLFLLVLLLPAPLVVMGVEMGIRSELAPERAQNSDSCHCLHHRPLHHAGAGGVGRCPCPQPAG